MVRGSVQLLKIATIATLAILTVLGGQRVFDYAMDRSVSADIGDRVRFEIGEDDTNEQVADRLKKAGLINSPMFFEAELRFTNSAVLPGNYTLIKGMTVADIADVITGKVIVTEVPESAEIEVTFPEGWRIGQMAEEAEAEGLEGGYEAFIQATETINLEGYDFLADRPEGASLEGYLFPSTYTFFSKEPEYNIRSMLDTFDAQVTPEMRQRASEMGLTLHQVITLASLVEREAAVDEERPIIAGVYLNRLAEGWNLDADPTMQYIVGERGNGAEGWWPELDGETVENIDAANPYNTYRNPGLPPGPIANPGLDSINAVLYPEEHNYMYFVATDDGETHAFAVTAEEQQANVCRFQGC